MYDRATQKALLLIKEGNNLDGVLALYEAWMSGSLSAALFFKKNESLDTIPLTQEVLEARTRSRDSTEDFKLGLCYLSGIGIAQSDEKAQELFSILAEKHHAPAQNLLAWMYRNNRAGKELSQDERDDKAVKLYLQAATAGYAPAQNNLALMYQNNRAGKELSQNERDDKAVKLYLQAATAGDAPAQSNLAWMYENNRAGKELSQNERDDKVVQLYLQAIRAAHASAAWNLAVFYRKNNTGLALKYFSIAAILYRTADVDVQRCITQINSFPASALKDYALARIHRLDSKAIATQCAAFKALQRPSDCLLFINEDLERLGANHTYLRSVFEKLSSFAHESSVLALTEKVALAKLLLKMMAHLSQGDNSKVLTVEAQLETIQPYCTLLVKHQLEVLLHLDNEAKSDLEALATQLLSYVMLLDTRQHREFIHMFAKLLVAIPDDSAFWQENNNNLIRFLIAAFSHGAQPMLIKKQCSPLQFKALLIHIIQAPLDAALDDEPPAIDEAGLQMMKQYGVSIDIPAITKQVIQQQTTRPATRQSTSVTTLTASYPKILLGERQYPEPVEFKEGKTPELK
ncbi:sel1 repeat family protein [Legionella sp. PC1000]|nr:tetratricopeptide repeat protein [Legionella sp. PC1000]QLZ68927.1 sel1 repeat family protein [Legionella sp. PC1000]